MSRESIGHYTLQALIEQQFVLKWVDHQQWEHGLLFWYRYWIEQASNDHFITSVLSWSESRRTIGRMEGSLISIRIGMLWYDCWWGWCLGRLDGMNSLDLGCFGIMSMWFHFPLYEKPKPLKRRGVTANCERLDAWLFILIWTWNDSRSDRYACGWWDRSSQLTVSSLLRREL